MEILYLPTATPRLSAVESVWKDAKYRLVTSEHHEALEDLTHAVSEYFRTCPIRRDIYKFLTAAYEAKFSMSGTLDHIRIQRLVVEPAGSGANSGVSYQIIIINPMTPDIPKTIKNSNTTISGKY